MNQKNLLITGTTKGIGRLLAEYYLSHNFNVVGLSRSAGTIQHESYRHHSIDLTSQQQISEFFSSYRSPFGDFNYMINNAGITTPNSLFLYSSESILKTFQTNIIAPIELVKFVAREMQKNQFGRIVNITTTASYQGVSGQSMYISSKQALESFSTSSCEELSQFGITINNLAVSYFDSDLNENLNSQKKLDAIHQQKIKRICQQEDITNVIDFYFNSCSQFVSGQTIKLAGL